MKTDNINLIIDKYLSNSISAKELDVLENYIKSPKNEELFKEYVILNYVLNKKFKSFEPDLSSVIKLLNKNTKHKVKKQSIIKQILKYAAVITLLFSIGYLVKNKIDNSNELPSETLVNVGTVGTNKAVLTLENGSEIALEEGKTYTNSSVNSDGEKLVYANSKEPSRAKKEIAYNYLAIPRGGEFYIEIEDNTKIWLNSESKIKYPVAFVKGETREVELLYGEAYFDVSPSSMHNGDRFMVKKDQQYIEVLGTEFNIKSYKDGNSIETVLVEGKVMLTAEKVSEELIPNQQLVLNKANNSFKINQVNAKDLTSWKTGNFKFTKQSLLEVTNVLARWYNVEFYFENKELENLKINGAFSKYKSVESFLLSLKHTNKITFEIEDKIIIIK